MRRGLAVVLGIAALAAGLWASALNFFSRAESPSSLLGSVMSRRTKRRHFKPGLASC